MEINLVVEGLKFMVLGMGTVFVFLSIMILAMNIQTKILQKFFPDAPKAEQKPVAQAGVTKSKVAAIMGAIMQHNTSK